MRTSDVISHLIAELPKHCDDFTDSIALEGLSVVAGVATAVTSTPHGLIAGQQVSVVGTQVPIDATISRVGDIATLSTAAPHDITENAGYDVQVSSTGYNGAFELLAVPNRQTILFRCAGDEPASDFGLLINGSNVFEGYNGVHTVTAVTPLTFSYSLPRDLADAVGGEIKGNPRISGATNFDRLLQSYTKQPAGSAYLFAVLGDSIAHKDRNTDTDSTANITHASHYNQRLSQSVTLYVFMPTSGSLSGRAARDRCEELLGPICKAILSAKLPTLVSAANNPLMLLSHGFEAYNSSAFYVHQYSFEATIQLCNADIYTGDNSVAFRDIDLSIGVSHGTGEAKTLIDLDDRPL